MSKNPSQAYILLNRLLKATYYYSGLLEKHYLESIKQGAQPWRILKYERVTNPDQHIYPLALHKYVRPETFEMHLKFLKKNCQVISLEELTKKLSQKKRNSTKNDSFDIRQCLD